MPPEPPSASCPVVDLTPYEGAALIIVAAPDRRTMADEIAGVFRDLAAEVYVAGTPEEARAGVREHSRDGRPPVFFALVSAGLNGWKDRWVPDEYLRMDLRLIPVITDGTVRERSLAGRMPADVRGAATPWELAARLAPARPGRPERGPVVRPGVV